MAAARPPTTFPHYHHHHHHPHHRLYSTLPCLKRRVFSSQSSQWMPFFLFKAFPSVPVILTLTNSAWSRLARLSPVPSLVPPSRSVTTLLRPRLRLLRSPPFSSRESVVFRKRPTSLRLVVSSRSGTSPPLIHRKKKKNMKKKKKIDSHCDGRHNRLHWELLRGLNWRELFIGILTCVCD